MSLGAVREKFQMAGLEGLAGQENSYWKMGKWGRRYKAGEERRLGTEMDGREKIEWKVRPEAGKKCQKNYAQLEEKEKLPFKRM